MPESTLNWNVIVHLPRLVFLRRLYRYIILTAFAKLYREYSINDFRLRLSQSRMFIQNALDILNNNSRAFRGREREREREGNFLSQRFQRAIRAYGDNKGGDVTREFAGVDNRHEACKNIYYACDHIRNTCHLLYFPVREASTRLCGTHHHAHCA